MNDKSKVHISERKVAVGDSMPPSIAREIYQQAKQQSQKLPPISGDVKTGEKQKKK